MTRRRKETRREDTWFREVGCTGKDNSPVNRPIIEAKVKKLERILVAVQENSNKARRRTITHATIDSAQNSAQR